MAATTFAELHKAARRTPPRAAAAAAAPRSRSVGFKTAMAHPAVKAAVNRVKLAGVHVIHARKPHPGVRRGPRGMFAGVAVGKVAETRTDIVIGVPITKVDDDRRFVAGWASVIEVDGQPVTDVQSDVIHEDEMVTAAHEFMRSWRVGKAMHKGAADKVEFVESVAFTPDMQKALGIDLGRVGWWVAGYVRDDATWAAVKAGELPSFSIGGTAVREALKA